MPNNNLERRSGEQMILAFLREIYKLRDLWCIFSGFYLVAYTFWGWVLPVLTLVAGLDLLFEGFSRSAFLFHNVKTNPLWYFNWVIKHSRVRFGLYGTLLLTHLALYIPDTGRIVAHWPLDLVITALAGGILVSYSVRWPTWLR